jgi:hypothetical protein
MVLNLAPFNGWDIQISVDSAALNPTSISTASNLFTITFGLTVTEFINCVNGGFGIPFNQPGNIGCTAFDGPGLAHSAGVISSRPPTTSTMSGLLFTVTYTAGTGIVSVVHISQELFSDGTANPVPAATVDGIYGQTGPPSHFVHGKLSWTHHLSLAKNSGKQTFTATLRDESSTAEFVQVLVQGDHGFTAKSLPQQVMPGVVTKVPIIATVDSSLVGSKICFTATLIFGDSITTIGFPSQVTKSGCFAVVT